MSRFCGGGQGGLVGQMLCDLGLHRVDPAAVWNGGIGFSRCRRCHCEMVQRPGQAWAKAPRGYAVVWRTAAVEAPSLRDMADSIIGIPDMDRSIEQPAIGVASVDSGKSLGDLLMELDARLPLAELGPRADEAPPVEDRAQQDRLVDPVPPPLPVFSPDPSPATEGVSTPVAEMLPPSAPQPAQSADPERPSASVRALASIRRLGMAANRSLTMLEPPRAQASRSYRYLVQRIAAQSAAGRPVSTVLVSAVCDSDAANETLLLLSAMMQDELGGRVLVIDATLRDGGIGGLLGAQGQPGLSEARADLSDALLDLIRPLHREALFLLGPGIRPATSRVEDMATLLPILSRHFDHILIQQHAITADTRYLALASRVDLVLVLAEEGQSRMASLSQCRDTFRANGIENVGLILTVPPSTPEAGPKADAHAA